LSPTRLRDDQIRYFSERKRDWGLFARKTGGPVHRLLAVQPSLVGPSKCFLAMLSQPLFHFLSTLIPKAFHNCQAQPWRPLPPFAQQCLVERGGAHTVQPSVKPRNAYSYVLNACISVSLSPVVENRKKVAGQNTQRDRLRNPAVIGA
jgi:hypothetical protein